jgi:hypothetical protein
VAVKAVRWHRHGRLWWYRWRFVVEVLKRGVDVIHRFEDRKESHVFIVKMELGELVCV